MKKRCPIIFELSPMNAIILLGNLQLSLRHEQNTGVTSQIMRDLAEHIESTLEKIHPDFRELTQMGWNEVNDNSESAMIRSHELYEKISETIELNWKP
jgi:imidazoleglycerol phosphate synthase glutamine amidotransferase subunit HisH